MVSGGFARGAQPRGVQGRDAGERGEVGCADAQDAFGATATAIGNGREDEPWSQTRRAGLRAL